MRNQIHCWITIPDLCGWNEYSHDNFSNRVGTGLIFAFETNIESEKISKIIMKYQLESIDDAK
jgi:hypothetical protein